MRCNKQKYTRIILSTIHRHNHEPLYCCSLSVGRSFSLSVSFSTCVYVTDGWNMCYVQSFNRRLHLLFYGIAYAALFEHSQNTRVIHQHRMWTKTSNTSVFVYVYARADICVCVRHVSKWESQQILSESKFCIYAECVWKQATGSKVDVYISLVLVYICHVLSLFLATDGKRKHGKKRTVWAQWKRTGKNEFRFSMQVTAHPFLSCIFIVPSISWNKKKKPSFFPLPICWRN